MSKGSNGLQDLFGGSQVMKEPSFDGSASHGCMLGTSMRVIGEYRWGNSSGYNSPCSLRSFSMDLEVDTSLKTFLGKER